MEKDPYGQHVAQLFDLADADGLSSRHLVDLEIEDGRTATMLRLYAQGGKNTREVLRRINAGSATTPGGGPAEPWTGHDSAYGAEAAPPASGGPVPGTEAAPAADLVGRIGSRKDSDLVDPRRGARDAYGHRLQGLFDMVDEGRLSNRELAYIESEDAGMASLLRGYIAGDEDIRDALRQINAGSGTAQVGDAGWGQVLNCEFLACSQALMILLTEE